MYSPEDPLFTPLLPLARVPFQAKESVHKTPFWESLEILASTASIFTEMLAHKPQNLEIFRSQAPPLFFQRQMSVRKHHTSEIRAAHPYLKKSWVPPPPRLHFINSDNFVVNERCHMKNPKTHNSFTLRFLYRFLCLSLFSTICVFRPFWK